MDENHLTSKPLVERIEEDRVSWEKRLYIWRI